MPEPDAVPAVQPDYLPNASPIKQGGEGGCANTDTQRTLGNPPPLDDARLSSTPSFRPASILSDVQSATPPPPTDAELLAATRTVLSIKKVSKLVSFRPYDECQMAFFLSEKRRLSAFGNNRSGKTTAGTARAGFHFTGWYPEWFPKHRRLTPPTFGRITISEYKEHGRVLVEKIKEWFPADSIKKWYRNPQGYVTGLEGKNGSHISILTHEQETKAHEGWSGHWAWFDEPCPKDKFIATIRGLVDRNGECFFTLTPLSEPWLSDEIYEENPHLWDTFDFNAYNNPFINRQALDDFFSSVDPIELPARKFGKFIHLEGAVYASFSRQRHVVPQKALPEHWPRFCVIDPHDRRPFAIGWYAVDPTNRVWIYDESPRDAMFHKIHSTTLKTNDFVTIIRNQECRDNIMKRIIDRRYGMRRSVMTGYTIQEDLMQYDLYFEPSYDDTLGGIEAGHIAVKELLGRPDEEPRLLVMDNCKNHIYGFTHYVYDRDTGKPKEEGKDYMDLIRYLAKDNPRYDLWTGTRTLDNFNRGVSGYGE